MMDMLFTLMPANVGARVDRLSDLDVLRAFFLLDCKNKKEYRGFLQIPDLYLACAGMAGFDSPGDWHSYLAVKDSLLRKALALPCLRHVKDPPMIPDEIEFLDLKAIHGPMACPVCGEQETLHRGPRALSCIACGKRETLDTGCERGHHVCTDCLRFHSDKPACPAYLGGSMCAGRECTLLR
ncbi:MAG: hypothetical protein GYA24_11950 [Candidatus Lokiarchaeota archaeon]|nr:hypothetical protein [Candidatus Lokiarchaeota archaeon]